MTNRTITLDQPLYEYLLSVSLREPPLLARLRAETAEMDEANMQIAPEQGQFMGLLVRLTGARHILEVGTFTGYSALCLALAQPPDGELICCDLSEQWTATARRFWQEAGVAGRIHLRIGSALDTLDALLPLRAGGFDMVFLDADKERYVDYYERALALLRPGGLLMVDNTLWDGAVVRPEDRAPSTEAIRALNARLAGDERIDLSLVPIGDGLTLARKRER
jgi:predicted O-methyltransferase YrrM